MPNSQTDCEETGKQTLDFDSMSQLANQRFLNLQDVSSIDPFQDIFQRLSQTSSSITYPNYQKIFKEKNFTQKSGNTPRKILEIFLQHFSEFKSSYSKSAVRKIEKLCRQLKNWHNKDKKNVYRFEQLVDLFVSIEALDPENERTTREIFYKILRKYAISSLQNPRSHQIKDRSHYLRVLKIFSIRCRSAELVKRNQTR